jgi:hypothetical protein
MHPEKMRVWIYFSGLTGQAARRRHTRKPRATFSPIACLNRWCCAAFAMPPSRHAAHAPLPATHAITSRGPHPIAPAHQELIRQTTDCQRGRPRPCLPALSARAPPPPGLAPYRTPAQPTRLQCFRTPPVSTASALLSTLRAHLLRAFCAHTPRKSRQWRRR